MYPTSAHPSSLRQVPSPRRGVHKHRDRQLQVINGSVFYPVTYMVESGSRDDQKFICSCSLHGRGSLGLLIVDTAAGSAWKQGIQS